jgi:hypothetical protein
MLAWLTRDMIWNWINLVLLYIFHFFVKFEAERLCPKLSQFQHGGYHNEYNMANELLLKNNNYCMHYYVLRLNTLKVIEWSRRTLHTLFETKKFLKLKGNILSQTKCLIDWHPNALLWRSIFCILTGGCGKVGVTYIRWGKKTCPSSSGTTLVYEGNINLTACFMSCTKAFST